MALTSQQKHYIKKNVDRRSPEEIALHLNLPQKEISKFIKKHWGGRKFQKLSDKKHDSVLPLDDFSNFNFKKFFIDNINCFILLFVLVLTVYFNSLSNEFVSDDIPTILKNPDVGNLRAIIDSTPYLIGLLHSFIDLVVFKIAGLNPLPYRLVNVLFHLGSAWIVFIIFSLMAKRPVAFFASALFAVHPLLTESVTWISGAPYSMYGFFALLSFLFYILSANDKKLYYFSIVSFIFALFSSNKVIFFPFVLILYEFSLSSLKNNWKKLIAFFLTGGFVLINSLGLIGQRIKVLNSDFYQNASNNDNLFVKIPTAITTYFKLMLWPADLSLYQTELNFSAFQFTIRTIIFLLFLALIFYGWKKNRLLFFWPSFLIASLATSLTPFKIAWVVAERYIYLGSIGGFFAFAVFFDWLMEKSGEKYKPVFYGIFAIIIIALSARTIIRNVDWKDEDHLWPATVKVSPSGAPIHNNMGDVYARRQDYPKAIEEFTKATQINPGYADAYHNLANTYQMTGDANNAVKYYNKALSINPNIWQSYQNLAAIFFQSGDKNKAMEYIQKALTINPNDPGLQSNLKIIQGGAQ